MHEFRDGEPRPAPSSPTPWFESGADSRARLEEIGDLHFHAAAYSSAAEYFRSALRALLAVRADEADVANRCSLHLKLADCYRLQGLYPEASEELDSARAATPGDDRRELARIDVRRARILQERGRFDEAIDLALGAFSVLSLTDRHRDVAGAQMVLGIANACSGRVVKAEEFFQDALATYRRIDDVVSQAHVLNNLALLAKRACHWTRALKLYERAEELFRVHGATYESNVLHLNKAVLYRKMGQRAEAMACALRGLKLARSRGDHADQGRLSLLLGQLHTDEGRFSEAEELLLEAKVLAERLDSGRDQALADEFLGDLMRESGRLAEAEANYLLAEERANALSESNDILAEVRRRRAELALALDDPDEALSLAASAFALVDATGEEFERGFLHRTAAMAHANLGRRAQAIDEFELAAKVFRRLRLAGEVSVTLVAFAEFLLESQDRDEAVIARARLREALALEDLEGAADATPVHFALARAELSLGGAEEALISLYEIERREGSDSATLGAADELRRRVEEELARSSKDHVDPYRLLAGLPELVEEDDFPRSEALASVLAATVERLGAERGLVAVRDPKGRCEVLATHSIAQAAARGIAVRAFDLLGSQEAETPRVWSQISREVEWAPLVGSPRGPMESAVAFRLVDAAEGLEGLFFFDTDAADLGALPFGADSLALASTYVEILKARVLEAARQGNPVASTFAQGPFARIVTQSDKVMEVLDLCAKVAPSPYTALLNGETGTGKGMLARMIHELSPRASAPFIAVNCAAIPEPLLESELFGHVRGSFTGAERDKDGLIVAARGGTLFLDEVGKMPLTMQSKLLQFLDSNEVRPVGGTRSEAVDVRVLFASKRDLKELVAKELFLEDLYYRLLDFPITVPALRSRGEDVLLLAETFVARTAAELGRRVPRLTRSAVSVLRAYPWPGNVRELEKAMRRAVVLADGEGRLRESHLPEDIRGHALGGGNDELHSDLVPLKEQVAELEKHVVQNALESLGWNRSEAARRLKISYPTLLQKIRIHGLRPS